MAISLLESLEQVSDPRNLDAGVEEVFQLMLGVDCKRFPGPVVLEPETVTAVIGFGGLFSGACVLKCGSSASRRIVSLMTGSQIVEIDNMVKDGIGELCNMLAGAWRSKVKDSADNCVLSIPAVITGRDYNFHVNAFQFRIVHCYSFEDASLEVIISCNGLGEQSPRSGEKAQLGGNQKSPIDTVIKPRE